MMYLASLHHSLIVDSDTVVYLADEGSRTPHSVLVNGEIHELIDPPTLKVEAYHSPLPISEDDFV